MATHQFDVDNAIQHGIEAAILLENIRFWLVKNKANGVNAKEGYWWTYNSAEAFHKLFPYMSRQTIARVLTRLCDKQILFRRKLSEANFDKKYWYTIPAEFSTAENEVFKPEPALNSISHFEQSTSHFEQSTSQNEQRNSQNEQRNSQNEQRNSQNEQAITDIKPTDIKPTDIKPTDIKPTDIKAVDKSESKKQAVDNSVYELLGEYGIIGSEATDFVEHRKLKKAVINRTVLNNFAKESAQAGISIQEAVEITISRGWTGFKAEWHKPKEPPQQNMPANLNQPPRYIEGLCNQK